MKTFLVTRPAPHGQALCDGIQSAGASCIYLPVIDIIPKKNDETRAQLARANEFDIIIFISPNAAHHSIESLPTLLNTTVATVGKGTANVLESMGVHTTLCPDTQFDSNALLALPAMQNVKGKSILIVKGIGGSTTLFDALTQRDAHVTTVDVYARRCPTESTEKLSHYLQTASIDFIVCTSCEGIDNLVALTPAALHSQLLTMRLIVTHPKQLAHAKSLGFGAQHLLTANAQNETILASLILE